MCFFSRLGFSRSFCGGRCAFLRCFCLTALACFLRLAACFFGLALGLLGFLACLLRFALGFFGFALGFRLGTASSFERLAAFVGRTATRFFCSAPFVFGALAARLFFAATLFGLAQFLLNQAVDLVVECGVSSLLRGDGGLQLPLLAVEIVDHLLLFALLVLELGLLFFAAGQEIVFCPAFGGKLLPFAANHGFALRNGQPLCTLIARVFLHIADAAIHLAEVARGKDEHEFVLREAVAKKIDDASRIAAFALGELPFEHLQLRFVAADAVVERVEIGRDAVVQVDADGDGAHVEVFLLNHVVSL